MTLPAHALWAKTNLNRDERATRIFGKRLENRLFADKAQSVREILLEPWDDRVRAAQFVEFRSGGEQCAGKGLVLEEGLVRLPAEIGRSGSTYLVG